MTWGDRKGERPVIHQQVMGQYLELKLGKSWILPPEIKPAEPVLHPENQISLHHMTAERTILDLQRLWSQV